MTKTDMAWVLSLGFFSSGTSESRRNENICFADGAISKILRTGATGGSVPYGIIIRQMQCGIISRMRRDAMR